MLKAYAFAGTTMTILVPGKATNGAFTILHVIKPNGSSTPLHSHDDETELSYVLSGSLGVETRAGKPQLKLVRLSCFLPVARTGYLTTLAALYESFFFAPRPSSTSSLQQPVFRLIHLPRRAP